MNVDLNSSGNGLAHGAIVMLVICVGLWLAAAWFVKRKRLARFGPAPAFCPGIGDEPVTKVLKRIRQKFNVPAMAAAVVTSDGLTFIGAVGVRKRGTEIPVTLADLWHLGSNTKAMTSTLIARLVERGRLKWDSTLAGIFPDLAAQMDPEFRKVNLLQLLSHRAGLPPNLDRATYSGNDVQALRLRAVREYLAPRPETKPGSTTTYSNLGYIIAGAVVEKATGQTWERAIADEVFQPLQMNSAGFGGTGTPGQIDQPWPHTRDGKPTANNGPELDNPPVMGPAGRVHASIQDWGKFIQDQLRGARGEPALLKSESYQKLQTPACGGNHVLGWIVAQRRWGGGTVLNHSGDNTMNFANVWVSPKKNFAVLVCVNQSGDTAFRASDEAVGALIKLLQRRPK
jgi:CubicO group peptidase (beta-lactamase class C family)